MPIHQTAEAFYRFCSLSHIVPPFFTLAYLLHFWPLRQNLWVDRVSVPENQRREGSRVGETWAYAFVFFHHGDTGKHGERILYPMAFSIIVVAVYPEC